MVHTVPVKQEKELVNLPRQRKFIQKKGYTGAKWWQSNSQELQAELRATLEEKSHGRAEFRPQIQDLLIKAV